MNLDEDMADFKDDLDGIRNGGSSESGSKSSSKQRTVGKDDMPDLGLGDGESSLPTWAEYGIYAALIIAIVQIYVGFTVPDATLLYVFAIGFLVLGLWAGAKKHEELAAAWERVQERRGE